MNKHTPGPWEFDGYDVVRTQTLAPFTVAVVNLTSPQGNEIERANARLIAAAPDMLEALEGIAKPDGFISLDYEALHKALAAIRKAKGE